jgi:hypothetical protein
MLRAIYKFYKNLDLILFIGLPLKLKIADEATLKFRKKRSGKKIKSKRERSTTTNCRRNLLQRRLCHQRERED